MEAQPFGADLLPSNVYRPSGRLGPSLIAVPLVSRIRNDEGKLEENVDDLAQLLLIQPRSYQTLEAIAARPAKPTMPDFLVEPEPTGSQGGPAVQEGYTNNDDQAQ